MFDDHDLDRTLRDLQFELELLLNGRKEGRTGEVTWGLRIVGVPDIGSLDGEQIFLARNSI